VIARAELARLQGDLFAARVALNQAAAYLDTTVSPVPWQARAALRHTGTAFSGPQRGSGGLSVHRRGTPVVPARPPPVP